MPYGDKITTSKHGRRLGLQQMSSAASGGSFGTQEFLVGPQDNRVGVTTATSADAIPAYGITRLAASAGSSAFFVLDPPIPGVMKVIEVSINSSSMYVNAGDAVFVSTAGSTQATLKSTGGALGAIALMGVTTGVWAVMGQPGPFTAVAT